eukprot:9832478-Prorocentrum_lima.AAC.1
MSRGGGDDASGEGGDSGAAWSAGVAVVSSQRRWYPPWAPWIRFEESPHAISHRLPAAWGWGVDLSTVGDGGSD